MTSEGQEAGQHGAGATSGGEAEQFPLDAFPPDSDDTRTPGADAYGPPHSYGPPPGATPNGGSPFVVPAVPPPGRATEPLGPGPTSGSARVPPAGENPPLPRRTPSAPGSPWSPDDRSSVGAPFLSPPAGPPSPGGSRPSAAAEPPPSRSADGRPHSGPVEPHPYRPDGPLAPEAGSSPGTRSPEPPGPAGGPAPAGGERPPGVSAFGNQKIRVPGATLIGLPDAPPSPGGAADGAPGPVNAGQLGGPGALPRRTPEELPRRTPEELPRRTPGVPRAGAPGGPVDGFSAWGPRTRHDDGDAALPRRTATPPGGAPPTSPAGPDRRLAGDAPDVASRPMPVHPDPVRPAFGDGRGGPPSYDGPSAVVDEGHPTAFRQPPPAPGSSRGVPSPGPFPDPRPSSAAPFADAGPSYPGPSAFSPEEGGPSYPGAPFSGPRIAGEPAVAPRNAEDPAVAPGNAGEPPVTDRNAGGAPLPGAPAPSPSARSPFGGRSPFGPPPDGDFTWPEAGPPASPAGQAAPPQPPPAPGHAGEDRAGGGLAGGAGLPRRLDRPSMPTGGPAPAVVESRGDAAVPQPRHPGGQLGGTGGSARNVTASASVPVAGRVAPPADAVPSPATRQPRLYGRAPSSQPDTGGPPHVGAEPPAVPHPVHGGPGSPDHGPDAARPHEPRTPQDDPWHGDREPPAAARQPGGGPEAGHPHRPAVPPRVTGRAVASARVAPPPAADPVPAVPPQAQPRMAAPPAGQPGSATPATGQPGSAPPRPGQPGGAPPPPGQPGSAPPPPGQPGSAPPRPGQPSGGPVNGQVPGFPRAGSRPPAARQPGTAGARDAEIIGDVAGRGRPQPPRPADQYGELTTDVAGRDGPYVPAPALPAMHARPPLVDGFPPPPPPNDANAAEPERPQRGSYLAGATSRAAVTPPGADATSGRPETSQPDQGRFDAFKPDAVDAPAKAETPHVRMLPTVLVVALGAVLLVGLGLGFVWLIAPGGDNSLNVKPGDCVKRRGAEAIAVTCTESGAFEVVSKVSTKDQCADRSQPYVVNPIRDGRTQVLCLKPRG
jgi:collagen type III alpha